MGQDVLSQSVFYSLAVISILLMCFPNFGVFTLVLEQSALTQGKYYLPPASSSETKWRSFFCRTEPQWPSLSLILHIFHYKCFLFSQRISQQQKHFPCVCNSSESRLMVKQGFLLLHWGDRPSPAQDPSAAHDPARKSSLLLKTTVHGSPQTILPHFWAFSPSFPSLHLASLFFSLEKQTFLPQTSFY